MDGFVQNLQNSKIFEELGLGRGNKKEKAKIIRLLTEVKLMSPNIYNRGSLSTTNTTITLQIHPVLVPRNVSPDILACSSR